MVNERWLELIHAEIDQTLTPQERAELNRLLLADPEFRRQRDALVAACKLLDGIEPVPVPAGLTQSIVDRIPLPVASRERSFWRYPVARYAASFGAGLAVAVLAFQTAGPSRGDEFNQLAGTMASPAKQADIVSDTLKIATEQLNGQAWLRQPADSRLALLEIQLQSAQPVEVIADFNGRSARIENPAGAQGHFGIVLDEEVGEVSVKFVVAGEVVEQRLLRNADRG